ncbi:MAG: BtrH N-terminal domain-containing protein [Oscillospiraceae bacterium]|nr:BtrH N-terminal domain-containing protein [Oscillospiraceae bacterium]
MKKILDVKQPLISCYTAYGTLFSILPKQLDSWIYSNFIQLVYNKLWGTYTFEGHRFVLKDCPGIVFHTSPRDKIMNDEKTLIDMIKSAIDAGEYVYLFVDKYYISADKLYHGKKHFEHEILVYGYDQDNDLMFVADNFADGKFAFSSCPSGDIDKAFMRLKTNNEYAKHFGTLIVRPDVNYSLDIEKIKHDMNAFLSSQKSYYMRKEQDMIFGVKIFENLKKQIICCAAYGMPLDVRAFHMIYEHLLLMEERVRYMVRENYMTDVSELCEFVRDTKESAFLLRNCVIKYNVRRKENMFESILSKLCQLKDDEIKMFETVLDKIL